MKNDFFFLKAVKILFHRDELNKVKSMPESSDNASTLT